MFFDVTQYSKETELKIINLVGKPFSIWQRLKMGGNGSQRLFVAEANEEIRQILFRQNTPPYTNIELRPNGIILRFRIKLDNYLLAMPYFKLHIYKNSEHLIVYADQWKLKLKSGSTSALNQVFIRKLMGERVNYLQQSE